jgi:hypothetical protein
MTGGLECPLLRAPEQRCDQPAIRFAYDPVAEHLAARLAAQVQPSAGAGPLKDRILSAPGSAVARVLAEIENSLGRPLQLPQSELSRVSVFCRFNFLIVRFYLPVGRIYFAVRSPREFPFGCFVISITCRHGLGRRTAWDRVFRSIFPPTGKIRSSSTLRRAKLDTPRRPQPAGFPFSRQ